MGLFPDKIFITKTNRNQFGVAFSLLNNLKTKRSFSLEYYFGFGMLVSSNDLYKHLGDGEIQAIIYPTKYIDSIYYFLSSIHQNTISPTILGGIVLDKKIKNGLVFCIGVHFESGFVDSKSQFIVFKYYHHQGFNSTNYEFATSANASFVFTTGIKFSNTIFKKTKK
jgi:hypothetical protein